MRNIGIPACEKRGGLFYPIIDGEGTSISDEGYHALEVIGGLSVDGEVDVALVGVQGAARYILSGNYTKLFPEGYQEYDVRGGQLYGINGVRETHLSSWPPTEDTDVSRLHR